MASSNDFGYDRFLVEQPIRPIANLYRVTPLAAGDAPVAFVRQKKLQVKEDIRFYGDEGETEELFRIKARQWLDTGGSRYDVLAGHDRIGTLEHVLGKSLLRSTWRIRGAGDEEVAIARERSQVGGFLRRAVDFIPDVGGLIPIPYNFEILIDDRPVGGLDRKFELRDRYVLDLAGDHERKLDRRVAVALAVGLDALQNR